MYDGKIGLYLLEKIEESREAITEREYDVAIRFLNQALTTINDKREIYSEEGIKICKLLALCYRKKNLLTEGIESLRMAEELCRKLYLKGKGEKWRMELAVCYVNEAIVYDSQNQINKAITLYESAIELFKDLKDDESTIKVMLSLCKAYSKIEHDDKVKRLYEEALNIIENDFLLENYRMLFYKMKEDILDKKEKDKC